MKAPRQRWASSAQDILCAFKDAKSVLISGHLNADGDSLGSMIALAHLLNRAGIQAVAAGERKGLGVAGFLRGTEGLVPYNAAAQRDYDLFVVLDCGAVDRLPGPLQKFVKLCPTINIDHHLTNTQFGTFNWVDAHASSAGEMIWRLARKAGWPLDDVSAEALWVSVITDSGRFAHDNTRPAVLRCGADLLRYGVRVSFINDKIYASFTATNIDLKRRAFKTLTLINNGAVAAVSLTRKDFEETGGAKADAEDVIDIPRHLAGNRVALFFYESEGSSSETRISIRTRDPLNAAAFATRFGGGGHNRAAGCTINKPLDQTRALILKAAAAWVSEG